VLKIPVFTLAIVAAYKYAQNGVNIAGVGSVVTREKGKERKTCRCSCGVVVHNIRVFFFGIVSA